MFVLVFNRKEFIISLEQKVTYLAFCSEFRNDRFSEVHDWFHVRFIEIRYDTVVQAACLRRLKLLLIYVTIFVAYSAGQELRDLRETLDNRNHLGPHFL